MKKMLYIVMAVLILAIIGFLIVIQVTKNKPLSGKDVVIIHVTPVTDTKDTIRVNFPAKDEVVTSPLIVSGEARGTWYFEASFPVVLVDWDGKIIAQGQAQALKDWMTTDFVPFTASLTFVKPADSGPQSTRGALILKKDNPSGLPQNDASLEIPVKFQ